MLSAPRYFLNSFVCTLFLLGAVYAPSSKATRFELQTPPAQAGQAFYRVSLPASVYYANTAADTDWNVTNSAGEAVPFGLIKLSPPVASTTTQSYPLSVFAITQEALSKQATQLNVEFSQGKRTPSSIRVQSQSQATQMPVVFLAKTRFAQIAQIQIKWRGAAGQAIGIEVLASDDLQSFRPIAQATLMNVQKGGESIVQDKVVFDRPIAAHYLQIRRVSPDAEPMNNGDFAVTEIISNELVAAADQPVDTRLLKGVLSEALSAPVVTASATQTFYDFQTHGRYPAEQLVLGLPQANTTATVTVLTRSAATQPWTQLTRASVYRLIQNNQETVNPALTFAPHDATLWRIAVNKAGGGLGAGIPSMQLRWQPHTLVWNARGPAPFQLTVGEPQATNAFNSINSIEQLLPASAQSQPEAMSLSERLLRLPEGSVGAAVKAAAAPAPKAATKPVSQPALRWWLWGGLGCGVLLLAFMGYSLLRQNIKTNTVNTPNSLNELN